MLDIEFIRQNRKTVEVACNHKNVVVDIDRLLKLDDERRRLQQEVDGLRQKRNQLSHTDNGQKPSAADVEAGKSLKQQLAKLEANLNAVEQGYKELVGKVPNLPLPDVPVGKSEADNVVAKTVGELPRFDFEPKNHWQLAEPLGLIDKERAAKVAGTRFAYLRGGLVRLQFALMQYGLDVLGNEELLAGIAKSAGLNVSAKPFIPVLPPAMARTEIYAATGRLDSDQMTYKLADDDLWLNASAEHTLCPMYQDEILKEADLPLRYAGYTTAFRREAGTYGKDTEGIIRMHQFDKLEMESFTTATQGLDEHLFMIAIQEYLTAQLKLPYQVILKCTADIGGPNARGVDINTWLPGQNRYIETHTADYMSDYQSRRLRTKVRCAEGQTELAHTSDATAFSQRPLIAIMENYQTKDGKIKIPDVLQPYMKAEYL